MHLRGMKIVFVSFVSFVVDNSNPYIIANTREMNHKVHKEHKEHTKNFDLDASEEAAPA